MEGDLVLYVGKTTMSLKAREASHRCPSNTASSRHIPKDSEWEIVLVDEVPDEEETEWERYYYETLDPLYNAYMPGRKKAEWHKTNNFQCQKNWRIQNKEKWNEYMRKYVASKKNATNLPASQSNRITEYPC
jgi:hypothetical protein